MTGTAAGDLAIAICARCSRKKPYTSLRPDGNSPGLRVCNDGCWDPIDPYRLPARQTESISLQFPRPDTPLNNPDVGLSDEGYRDNIYIMTDDGLILQP